MLSSWHSRVGRVTLHAMTRRLWMGLALAMLTLVWTRPAQAKPPKKPLPAVGLSVAVAHVDGKPVVSKAWAAEQVAEAIRLLDPHGVHVREVKRRRLPARMARLESREDRDRLARYVERRVVNVFFVKKLKDVDRKNRWIQGVRWRERRNLKNDWVIVASNATPTTLAHELGHFFGNGHSRVREQHHVVRAHRSQRGGVRRPSRAQDATQLTLAAARQAALRHCTSAPRPQSAIGGRAPRAPC